jgi:acetyl esterase/lipase
MACWSFWRQNTLLPASSALGGEDAVTIDPFRTRDHVPDFDARLKEYEERSARTRATLRMAADLPYGGGEHETLDLFFPEGKVAERPIHLFIHGGYWRMFSKRDFSFIADTVTAAGAIAAIIDYALMPGTRMGGIVQQVRAARRWLLMNARLHGGNPARLTVSGHSAGAHLASLLFTKDQAPSGVSSALLLGGIYDLKPLQSSFLLPLIGLTDEEVRKYSPITHAFEPGVAVAVLHGERETEPFHVQAADFSRRLDNQRCRASLVALEGADHMSSVRDLGVPETEAGRALAQTIHRC